MKEGSLEKKAARCWEQAKEELPEANLAVISIPGVYAAEEADRALDEGLHVLLFSSNVTLEDERRLKEKAHKKGLLVMGPDCETAIIQGIPVAFANRLEHGKIGIVGASGTGIQELTAIIDRLGEGVTNAIGTGGRDLSAEVRGITMTDAVNAMEQDPEVEVVVVISKPPAREVRDKIVSRLSVYTKPVVTVFLGEKPEVHTEGFYHAYTLDEAARIAVDLLRGEKPAAVDLFAPRVADPHKKEDKKTIKAYYSGGTLANEAAMIIRDAMKLKVAFGRTKGYVLNYEGHIVADMGDDIYTKGRLHPKLDPSVRIECMSKAADDPTTGVILFDVVLGYGVHENMAGALLPVIQELSAGARKDLRKLFFVATICGTGMDPQKYEYQKKLMEDAGVIVCESNKHAVETALFCLGYPYYEEKKEIVGIQKKKCPSPVVMEKVLELFRKKPRIINIGFERFAESLKEAGCKVVQLEWESPVISDMVLSKELLFPEQYKCV